MWRYGDAGDKWPVQDGDLWRVGPHAVLCGDIIDGAGQRFLGLTGGLPSLLYVDPPWNQGNLRSFRTKAGLRNDVPQAEFDRLLGALIGLAVQCACPAFIECAVSGAEDLAARVRGSGGRLLGLWATTYYRRHPARLLGADFTPGATEPVTIELDGVDDWETPHHVAAAIGGAGPIFDPCCGRGLTAVAAHARGRTFWGVELNPRRMAVTLQKLNDLGAGTPTREEAL